MTNTWTKLELQDAIQAYLDLQSKLAQGEKIVKSDVYKRLSSKHNRTVKAFEYRMRNISYVLSLQNRAWVFGLPPAANVGENVINQIEEILAQLEERPMDTNLVFETKVDKLLNRKSIKKPNGNNIPKQKLTNVVEYERDPYIKAWILINSNGVCEYCQNEAPFKTKPLT